MASQESFEVEPFIPAENDSPTQTKLKEKKVCLKMPFRQFPWFKPTFFLVVNWPFLPVSPVEIPLFLYF